MRKFPTVIIEIAKKLSLRDKRFAGVFGALLLCLTFVAAQLITVQHTHDGELAHEADCPACAKQSNELDFVSISRVTCHLFGCKVIDENSTFGLVTVSIYDVNSRSPPAT